jgi:hypothetical protein
MAANVYSVNVVGYINVTVAPGFNMLANQLDVDGIDNIGTVLNATTPTGADGIEMLLFANNNYSAIFWDGSASVLPQPGWWDGNTGNATTNVIPPGAGFFVYNQYSTNVQLTLTGTVLQGTNATALTHGFTLISTAVPVPMYLGLSNGFPALDGDEYLSYTNVGHGGNYATPDYYDDGSDGIVTSPPGWWDGSTTAQVFPSPAVGQGYFIFSQAAKTWTNIFTVQ